MIGLDDIAAARRVIDGRIATTPLVANDYFSELFGARVLFKLEMFQKTGAYKVRGVLNKMSQLSPEQKANGVVTVSSGNHAQALAWAASLSGVSSTVVMPANAVQVKVDLTRGYGAEVVLEANDILGRMSAIQEERGLTMVHPFDDLAVIAGAGTVGVEIVEDCPDVDLVLCGIGGGGLVSGVAAAIKQSLPNARVVGVEPEGAQTMTLSLRQGSPVFLDSVDTVADGLAAPFVGEHTLAHVSHFVDEIVVVSDAEIVEAMFQIIERCKVVAEPAAASTLAALLTGKVQAPAGGTVVCVLSGGNVDRVRIGELMRRFGPAENA